MKKIFNILIVVFVTAFVAEAWGQAGQFSPWKAYQKAVSQSVKYQKTVPTVPYEAKEPDPSKGEAAGVKTPEETPTTEPAKTEEKPKEEVKETKIIKPLTETAETEAQKGMKKEATVSPVKPTIKTLVPSEEMKEVKVIEETKPRVIETKTEKPLIVPVPVLEKKEGEKELIKLEDKTAPKVEKEEEPTNIQNLIAAMMLLNNDGDFNKATDQVLKSGGVMADMTNYGGTDYAIDKIVNPLISSGFQSAEALNNWNKVYKNCGPGDMYEYAAFVWAWDYIDKNQNKAEVQELLEKSLTKSESAINQDLLIKSMVMKGFLPEQPETLPIDYKNKAPGAMHLTENTCLAFRAIEDDINPIATTPDPSRPPSLLETGMVSGGLYDCFKVNQMKLQGGVSLFGGLVDWLSGKSAQKEALKKAKGEAALKNFTDEVKKKLDDLAWEAYLAKEKAAWERQDAERGKGPPKESEWDPERWQGQEGADDKPEPGDLGPEFDSDQLTELEKENKQEQEKQKQAEQEKQKQAEQEKQKQAEKEKAEKEKAKKEKQKPKKGKKSPDDKPIDETTPVATQTWDSSTALNSCLSNAISRGITCVENNGPDSKLDDILCEASLGQGKTLVAMPIGDYQPCKKDKGGKEGLIPGKVYPRVIDPSPRELPDE